MSDSQGPDSPPPPGALVLMCGLPAAGKSTLSAALLRDGAKELLPRLAPFGVSAVRVFWLSFDDVLGNLAAACGHTGYSPELWHQARDSVLRSVRHHFGVACGDGPPPAPLAQLGESGGGSGSSGGAPASGGDSFDVVLLDDNMHYRSMRRVYHRLARDGRLGCCTLCLPLPLAEALRRNAARQESARVADATVSHMAEVLQWPDPARHPWECSTISLPSASSSGAGPPNGEEAEEARAEAAAATAASAAHALDLRLRAAVSLHLQSEDTRRRPAAERAALARAMSCRKKELLERAKAEADQGGGGTPEAREAVADALDAEFTAIFRTGGAGRHPPAAVTRT
ncbi:hypothetical protein EMIHUDRAFT_116308 [Emiliania huxleyi CCMP1516]|uniref:L-seryl-tRNA(Sec) kinase n=2 Tax=Emiliania huxleyi TaxID=2903 RepID=A0A0D3JJF2_EMIH1|nr:hypothetical protein EMIHUDRAFT_116308 [Emiliania huxleyi CCMP1516]EOD23637.1 hypothetical protein EMIHUDRAFT_116308 [Emiliania huxleyi CCMP1516]|eukprot:XP_005776066.1 hypothetical protein EMIHUDRAFT_116308 [Emiliania huxleyi CCMP1516]